MSRTNPGYGEPAIVTIGGGTGLSTMLRGLKTCTRNLTAIVTMADDGGGSGVLRDELHMPPPGDVRNCIQALANTEPTMAALLAYRFTQGSLKGQSFGNLFLAALNGICPSFDVAVKKMSEVLAITGQVIPVTNENVRLIAEFSDGSEVLGESKIKQHKDLSDSNIERVRLIPEDSAALPASLDAIAKAEMIVLGPGSLYTSIIPNLLTRGVADAIRNAAAVKVLVLNLMTQDGETERYTAADHISALFAHGGIGLFDYCLASNSPIPEDILDKYKTQGAQPILVRSGEIEALGVTPIFADLADWSQGLVRHNPDRLAKELLRLFIERSETRIYR